VQGRDKPETSEQKMNHIDIDMHRALSELDDPRRGITLKRNTVIDLVTALIDFLDDTEGDCDLEENGDLESSLGGGEWAGEVDIELDDCDAEDIDPDIEDEEDKAVDDDLCDAFWGESGVTDWNATASLIGGDELGDVERRHA
jgi:hypothetical protein